VPASSGVLPLVLGRATRLARFLSAGTKVYDAVLRLGVATDTYDAAGHPVGIPVPETIADCLQTTKPGVHTFALVAALVEDVVIVSDPELRRAMSLLFTAMKLVVEPGATAGFAGVLSGRVTGLAGKRVGVVLSGGKFLDGLTLADLPRPVELVATDGASLVDALR